MSALLAVTMLFVGLALVYAFWLRDVLRAHPLFAPVYAWIEPIEARLWDKSRTLLIARLYWLAGALVSVQALLQDSGIDWVSLLPIPPQYAIYVGPALWVTGMVFAKLRKVTSTPLEKV